MRRFDARLARKQKVSNQISKRRLVRRAIFASRADMAKYYYNMSRDAGFPFDAVYYKVRGYFGGLVA